jgi:hypothetical protein
MLRGRAAGPSLVRIWASAYDAKATNGAPGVRRKSLERRFPEAVAIISKGSPDPARIAGVHLFFGEPSCRKEA